MGRSNAPAYSALEISPEVNGDPSLAVPILVAYIERNPDVKAIITSHGTVTGFLLMAKLLSEPVR